MTARVDHRTVTAFAPASVSNIGAGLRATRTTSAGVVVASSGHPSISTDAARNTAGIAARETLRRAGASDVGVELRVEKGLPISGGQGGSAASAPRC